MSMSDLLRAHWKDLYPDEEWPGEVEQLRAMAEELRVIRSLLGFADPLAPRHHPDLRSREEIDRAHDLLVQLRLDQPVLDRVIHTADQHRLNAAIDVLCWILRHEHSRTFANILTDIELRLAALGYAMYRYPVPKTEKSQ